MPRPSFHERQQLDRERERRLIRKMMSENGLCSVMNDTKWQELCMAMYSLPSPPAFRTKHLLPRPIQPSMWDDDWYYHVRPYEVIEWMEIQPDEGESLEPIIEIVQRVGTVFDRLEDRVRVYGYTRATDTATGVTEA